MLYELDTALLNIIGTITFTDVVGEEYSIVPQIVPSLNRVTPYELIMNNREPSIMIEREGEMVLLRKESYNALNNRIGHIQDSTNIDATTYEIPFPLVYSVPYMVHVMIPLIVKGKGGAFVETRLVDAVLYRLLNSRSFYINYDFSDFILQVRSRYVLEDTIYINNIDAYDRSKEKYIRGFSLKALGYLFDVTTASTTKPIEYRILEVYDVGDDDKKIFRIDYESFY